MGKIARNIITDFSGKYNQVMTHATLFCQKVNEAMKKRKTLEKMVFFYDFVAFFLSESFQ